MKDFEDNIESDFKFNFNQVQKYILIFLCTILVFVVTFVAVALFRRETLIPMEVYFDPEVGFQAFMELSRDDRAKLLVESVWGSSLDDLPLSRISHRLFDQINIVEALPTSFWEVELITIMILNRHPYVMYSGDSFYGYLMPGLYLDLKSVEHEYKGLFVTLSESRVIWTINGFHNGYPFHFSIIAEEGYLD